VGSSVILPARGQPIEGPDPSFKSGAFPNIVSFGFEKVSPPSTLYIQRDDVLILTAVSALANEVVNFTVRIMLPVAPQAGQPDNPPSPTAVTPGAGGNNIVLSVQTIQLAAARTFKAISVPLMEGYLLSVTATSTLAVTRGQTYCSAFLKRSPAGGPPAQVGLFADYCTPDFLAIYPNGRSLSQVEGPGWSHSVNVANPAAGADWTLTMAAGQRMLVKSLSAVFVASAAVGNRDLSIIVDDGANTVWQDGAALAVTAGQTAGFNVTTASTPTPILASIITVVIPPAIFLVPGWRIRAFTTGILAGDQWSQIWLGVEEWIDQA